MERVSIDEQILTDIANAIRSKFSFATAEAKLKVEEMAEVIDFIQVAEAGKLVCGEAISEDGGSVSVFLPASDALPDFLLLYESGIGDDVDVTNSGLIRFAAFSNFTSDDGDFYMASATFSLLENGTGGNWIGNSYAGDAYAAYVQSSYVAIAMSAKDLFRPGVTYSYVMGYAI